MNSKDRLYYSYIRIKIDSKTYSRYNFHAVKTFLRKAIPAEYHCGYNDYYCLRLLVYTNSSESCSSILRNSASIVDKEWSTSAAIHSHFSAIGIR